MGHNYFFQIVGPPELRSNSCRFPRLKLASVCAQSMPRSRSFTVADGDCDFLSTRRSTHPTRRTGATPEKFPKNWGGERSTCSRCTWSTEVGPLAKTGPRVKAGGNLKLWDSDLIGGPRPPSGPPGRSRQGALQAHHGQAAPARSASAQRAPDRRLATLVRRSQRRHRLALGVSLDNDLALAIAQHALTAEPRAPSLGAL